MSPAWSPRAQPLPPRQPLCCHMIPASPAPRSVSQTSKALQWGPNSNLLRTAGPATPTLAAGSDKCLLALILSSNRASPCRACLPPAWPSQSPASPCSPAEGGRVEGFEAGRPAGTRESRGAWVTKGARSRVCAGKAPQAAWASGACGGERVWEFAGGGARSAACMQSARPLCAFVHTVKDATDRPRCQCTLCAVLLHGPLGSHARSPA